MNCLKPTFFFPSLGELEKILAEGFGRMAVNILTACYI